MNEAKERLCGVREPGGAYLETLTGDGGMPIEHFLVDPPIPVPAEMNLPNRGIAIFPRPGVEGVFDVYDRVGEASYPNVADFIEETRRQGLSRRIPTNAEFSLLTDESRIYLAHPRAIVENVADLYSCLLDEKTIYTTWHPWKCICRKPHHVLEFLEDMTCASCWYELLKGGEASWNPDDYPRTTYRKSGRLSYVGREAPEGFKPEYADGFFLRLPIHRIAVIRDEEQELHEQTLERVSRAEGMLIVLEDS